MAADYSVSDLPALQRARDIIISEDMINISFLRRRRELKFTLPPYSTVKELKNKISKDLGICILCLRLKDNTVMIDERPLCFYGIHIYCK